MTVSIHLGRAEQGKRLQEEQEQMDGKVRSLAGSFHLCCSRKVFPRWYIRNKRCNHPGAMAVIQDSLNLTVNDWCIPRRNWVNWCCSATSTHSPSCSGLSGNRIVPKILPQLPPSHWSCPELQAPPAVKASELGCSFLKSLA